MTNYFRATESFPFHVSIGGLVFNKEGKVCVHHYRDLKKSSGKIMGDLYLLLRETVEPHETIEQVLVRGLMEEFGMKGELVGCLGSIKGMMPVKDFQAEKTTIYFLVKYLEHDESKREVSAETTSNIEWQDPIFLIEKMKAQRDIGVPMDESEIVERFLRAKDSLLKV